MSRFFHRKVQSAAAFAFIAASMCATAQFKEVGPPPIPAPAARQQIRTLLEKVDPGNRQQTVTTISGLLAWYRDLVDEEIIAAWQKDGRANLPEVIESLADSHLASSIVENSWRKQREATFMPAYAPMFGHLMLRYPESAKPFLDDLLRLGAPGQPTPDLSTPEAETVCRILIDMPTDIGTWKKSALQILPHYRRTAESLLARDLHGDDQEKSYRAQLWLADLKSNVPAVPTERQSPRGRPQPSLSSSASSSADAPRAMPVAPPVVTPAIPSPAQTPVPASSQMKSGTLECSGNPIPQNGEYVFRNLPSARLQLEYDARTWDVHLAPGEGQTQRLILRNKSPGSQKRCVVHWTVVP
jgi:hypothetical protein